MILKRFKNFFALICSLLLVLSFTIVSPINAQEEANVSDFFREYITKCFSQPEKVKVLQNENDITDYFFAEYNDEFTNNNLKDIQNFINTDGVQISYMNFGPQNRATQSRSVTYEHYQSATDLSGTYTKEWMVNLQCYVTWDANTYKITNYNTPLLYISTATWGANWSSYMSGAYTDSPVINSNRTAVTFSAGYTMMGDYSYHLGITQTYNFRSHRISDTFYV